MTLLARFARTRLAQGTAMGFYAIAIHLIVQLVSVPVLTSQWGVAGYGIWVLLFTVPSLLAMADFGLTTAGANSMAEAAAKGEREQAVRIHSALRTICGAAALIVLAVAALVLFVLRPDWLDFAQHLAAGQARTTAMLLCGYGVLALVNGVTLAGFRAADAFAYSGMLYQTVILIEAMAGLGTAIAGGGPELVALAFFLTRLAGTAALSLALRRRAPWLRHARWRADGATVRELIKPALAALVLPGAHAVSLQGSVLVIGAIGGPAAVPAFAVVRTLSRSVLQFAMRFTVASMSRYTVFQAREEHHNAARLVTANLVVSVVLIVPAGLVLLWLGRPFIALWTGGTVLPDFALLAVMVLVMIADAFWGPLSNLMLAINRHAAFAYFYLGAAIASLALGAVLTLRWGALGMALAVLALQLAMVWKVWRVARQIGMIDRAILGSGLASLREELHLRGTTTEG
jgi:O-antigen/teichoic acid export membrane protein